MNIINRASAAFTKVLVVATAAAIAGSTLAPAISLAAADITPHSKVSFTFDDGLNSALTQAAPTLANYGFVGTDYVSTGCVGMTTVPNTCGANEDAVYMTWDQVVQLKTTYGWEIGSHTVTHPLLASKDPDFQMRKLTAAQVTTELTQSKADLAAHGIDATDFATPYGDYNQTILAQIAKLYASHRGFADTGYNASPYNDYIIRDQQVQAGVSVATVESYVDQAIASNQWLVLTFHDIQPVASTNPDDYQYNTTDLDQIAAYVKSKSVPVVTVNDGLVKGTNMFADSTFDNGLTNGWSTDAATYVKKDTANNGNYPSATNSISMKATTKNVHLFSPMVSVSPASTYILKNFINLSKISAGYGVSYYIDEYDVNGNWISGQYKQTVSFAWPQTTGFEYRPSSISVAKARLQLAMPANSGGTAFVDNFQWINENNDVVPPVQTNLMTNGTFDIGIAGGWTTDDAARIVADSSNNGSPSNPVNSVKLTDGTTNGHLFAPMLSVSNAHSYSIISYLDLRAITSGEVGFYIDEYDAGGNWISGQYKTGVHTVSSGDVGFNYTPSSANVAKASLQVIVMGNSGTLAYIDDIRWYQN